MDGFPTSLRQVAGPEGEGMIEAPFTGAQAGSALAALATIFIAMGGIALMMRARRVAARALGLGAMIALFAGLAAHIFR